MRSILITLGGLCMATHSLPSLSIVDAIETLSKIADLEFDDSIGISERHEIILLNEKVAYKSVHWFHQDIESEKTILLVRDTFQSILHYLRSFYKKEYDKITDPQALEEIKTIMVLVNEAGKKIDQFTSRSKSIPNVSELSEYKRLQEFFKNKLPQHTAQKGYLGNWILSLSIGKSDKKVKFRTLTENNNKSENKTDKAQIKQNQLSNKVGQQTRFFVDLESVKKDDEYEVFFIRKENGSRFFSPRLLRNMKMVSDLGSYFGERKELDPLKSIKYWQDHVLYTYAKELIKALGSRMDKFFRETQKIKDHELIKLLNKSLLALLLSSHSRNLLKNKPTKSCTEYFEDFQGFLREALQTQLYKKWTTQPPKGENQLAFELLDILHIVCWALYGNLQGLEEMKTPIKELIETAHLTIEKEQFDELTSTGEIVRQLTYDYQSMSNLMKHHPNGPLLKVIHQLENTSFHVFDSILQHNIPNHLFDMYTQDKRYAFLRIPAPIYQEFINKAIINDEFMNFIKFYENGSIRRKHLLINLQDRTSWREYARCLALEKLQYRADTENVLCVVTLATHTDFYNQLNPYHQLNHAEQFKNQFKEFLMDEHSGYFFPSSLSKKELTKFINDACEVVHRLFFSSKNVLSRENRLDFISLIYLLLELKIIEWIQPDTISLTCKDGIDVSQAHNVLMFIFIKLINAQQWTEVDWDHINFMIYSSAILLRERLILPEPFNRMISCIKTFENVRNELGAKNFEKKIQHEFSGLFKSEIAQAEVVL